MKLLNFSKAAILAIALIIGSSGFAGENAKKLTDCVYQSMTQEDKNLMTQWAFVSMAKLPANKELITIPPETIRAVQKNARKTLRTLVLEKCGAETTKVLVVEQLKGLKEAATDLAIRLVNEQLKGKAKTLPIVLSKDLGKTLNADGVITDLLKK